MEQRTRKREEMKIFTIAQLIIWLPHHLFMPYTLEKTHIFAIHVPPKNHHTKTRYEDWSWNLQHRQSHEPHNLQCNYLWNHEGIRWLCLLNGFCWTSSAGPHGTKSHWLLISCMSSLSPRWRCVNCYWKNPFTFISSLNEERMLVPVIGNDMIEDEMVCGIYVAT